MKKSILLLMALGIFSFTSCSKDDDGGGKSCQQLVEDYTDALSAYSEDPSDENCEKLDDAYEAYKGKDCEGSEFASGCSDDEI